MVQTSASEEGTSHLTEDGWAEAQRKIDVVGVQLIDLNIAVEAIPDCVASDLAASCVAQDVVPNLGTHVGQDFMDLLKIEDDEVVYDQSLDLSDLMSYTDSVAVHHFVGTEDDMQHFVEPEDCIQVFLHDHERPAAPSFCRSARQQPATATPTAASNA